MLAIDNNRPSRSAPAGLASLALLLIVVGCSSEVPYDSPPEAGSQVSASPDSTAPAWDGSQAYDEGGQPLPFEQAAAEDLAAAESAESYSAPASRRDPSKIVVDQTPTLPFLEPEDEEAQPREAYSAPATRRDPSRSIAATSDEEPETEEPDPADPAKELTEEEDSFFGNALHDLYPEQFEAIANGEDPQQPEPEPVPRPKKPAPRAIAAEPLLPKASPLPSGIAAPKGLPPKSSQLASSNRNNGSDDFVMPWDNEAPSDKPKASLPPKRPSLASPRIARSGNGLSKEASNALINTWDQILDEEQAKVPTPASEQPAKTAIAETIAPSPSESTLPWLAAANDTTETQPEPSPRAAEPAKAFEATPPAATPLETPRVASLAPPPTPQIAQAPLSGESIEPLPPVRVLPYNTRHIAWLLGAKLSLAELADLDGATPTELAAWSAEANRLAKELGMAPPETIRAPGGEASDRIARLLRTAGEAGANLAIQHGEDHAALLEISLKTNAVLLLAEERPELAAPVARALQAAARRAALPEHLWEQTAEDLMEHPAPDRAFDTVTRLHERVESFLR